MIKNLSKIACLLILSSCGQMYEGESITKSYSSNCQYKQWGEFTKNVPIFGDVFKSSLSTSLSEFKHLNLSNNSSSQFSEFSQFVSNLSNRVDMDIRLKITASNFAIGVSRGKLRDLLHEKADDAFRAGGLMGSQYSQDRKNLKDFLSNFVNDVKKNDYLDIKLGDGFSKVTARTRSGTSLFTSIQSDFLHKFSTPLVTDSPDARRDILSSLLLEISNGNARSC